MRSSSSGVGEKAISDLRREQGTCCFCHHEGMVNIFVGGLPGKQKEHAHCDLCYSTEAGSHCTVPGVHENTSLVRFIVQIAHKIIDEVGKS